MISAATSTPLAFSMPSSPGDAFTSSTRGPRRDRIRSTPATPRPSTRAARIAASCSAKVALAALAVPPRCRLERKSPIGACRFIDATTLVPTTKQRRSAPFASGMNSCTRNWAYSPRNASITPRDADSFSVNITPAPWVPSLSLMTCGGGPSICSRSAVSSGLSPNTVTGMPMPCAASIWWLRSLSRARRIASEELALSVPISSNWRNTAVP